VIDVKEAYWLIPNNVLINMLKTDPNGLSSIESSFRLSKLGNNRLDTKRKKISCPYFYLNLKVPLSLYLSLLHYCHFFLVKGKML
jgi:P-type Mg2+ transporter